MIKVRIFENAAGMLFGFEAGGHSNLGAKGEDIVCAGVSALTETALLGLGEHLGRDVEYDVRHGKQSFLSAKLKDAPDDLTQAVLATMLLGLREIAKLYPEAVNIEVIAR